MNNLKSSLMGAVGAAALILAQQAQAATQALTFYEPFPTSYGANGTSLNTSPAIDNVWTTGGGAGAGTPFFTNAPLSYSGLATSASSLSLQMPSVATGTRNRGLNFTTTTSGTLYASFLLDVLVAPTANRLIGTLTSDSSASAGTTVLGILINSSSQMMISKNSSSTVAATTTGTVNAAGTANLIVVRYTWNPLTTDDEFALWLNPTSLGGSAPVADIATTAGSEFADLDWFFLSQRNNAQVAGSNLLFDELRIGTSWADVTPAPVVPEPTTCALAGLAAAGLLGWSRRNRRS